MKSTFRTASVLTALCAALALGGVAAGATKAATPKQWMTNFCGSVVTWETQVKSDSKKLQAVIAGLKKSGKVDRHDAKARLVAFLVKIDRETKTLIRKLKAVGAPSTKNGTKLQAAVVSAFGQLGSAFENATTAARRLPTTTDNAFAKAAINLGATIQASINKVGLAFSAIGKYSTKQLDDAAKSIPACRKL